MSGQSEEADLKYVAFRAEAQQKFGDLERGAAHYAAEGQAFPRDERRAEHYENMAKILRGPEPGSGAKSSRECVIA